MLTADEGEVVVDQGGKNRVRVSYSDVRQVKPQEMGAGANTAIAAASIVVFVAVLSIWAALAMHS